VTARASRAIDIATLLYTPFLIWSTGGAQSPLLITVALPVAFYAQNFPGPAGRLRIAAILGGFSIGFWATGSHGATEITQFVTILVSVLTMLGVMLYSARRQSVALAQIRGAASRDRLTGLPNLYALHGEIENATADRTRTAVPKTLQLLVLDIDDFRRVNTFTGHAGGDEVLRAIADRVSRAAGEHRLHRVGGDEFAVLTRGLNDPQHEQLERRCLDAASGSYAVGGATISLTATSGRSSWSEGLTVEELIDRAEQSLRSNKSTKRRKRPSPPEVML
jgi:diguanylate cyclase (GGDEF)-like protein